MLYEDRNPEAFVARVLGKAGLAITGDRWNAGRCTCAEKSQPHEFGELGEFAEFQIKFAYTCRLIPKIPR